MEPVRWRPSMEGYFTRGSPETMFGTFKHCFKGLITEAKGLDSQQEVARGQLQDLVHKRQEAEKQGEALRRRAASPLKGSFGFNSNELVKFGVRPRKTGTRGPNKVKRKPAEQPPVNTAH